MRILLLLPTLVLACRTKQPPGDPIVDAAVHVQAAEAAAPLRVPCSLSGSYRGEVLGAPVFARLVQEGKRVHGRYFYDRVGIDIALEGTIDQDTFTLREGDAAKASGTFEGKCGSGAGAVAGGVLSGTWTGAKHGAFSLRPIENVMTAVKHRRTERKAKQPDAVQNHTTCVLQESWFELFGLLDSNIEQRLNRQGIALGRPTARPQEAKEAKTCDSGFEFEFSESIQLLGSELANVTERGSGDWGGAHPSNAVDHREYTIDLASGERVKYEAVFSKDVTKLVLACFAGGNKDFSDGAESFRGFVKRDQFAFAHGGIHFYGTGYPHVASVYTGEGPTISYAVLLRDGYLREDSPVKRAWEGTVAAAKGVSACPGAWGPKL
jgi:hypothetical protein